jgi:Family of unknown function (DUF5926)
LPLVSKRRHHPRPPERAEAARRPGSGRERARDRFVPRPFAGLQSEADWVALRELVPAATAPLRLAADVVDTYGEREVTLATVLPLAWPALTKPDGRVFVGLQSGVQSGDVSRDLGAALAAALGTEPGDVVRVAPGDGPRLQQLLATGQLEVSIHDNFQFWLEEPMADPAVQASLERANASVFPTVKLTAAPAAYWCRFPQKAHLRWVLPEDEDTALPALARLAAAGGLALGESTKFAGMFRAHGLLVPVWDLPHDAQAQEWENPLADLAQRYAAARSLPDELTAEQRRARQGLIGRQLTLR